MVRKHKCDWFGLPRSSNVLAQVCIICDVNAMQGRSKDATTALTSADVLILQGQNHLGHFSMTDALEASPTMTDYVAMRPHSLLPMRLCLILI
uniref:Uncharacterized protein n=1 Tax=Oryza nivara TaxID=4536 RepID=A0A0E0J1H0_ORYNI